MSATPTAPVVSRPGLRPRRVRAHPLGQLRAVLPDATWAGADPTDTVITGVTHDSRAVRAGDLYAALPGGHAHGARFLAQAAAAGAVAVLTDGAGAAMAEQAGLPIVAVPVPRTVLGRVADWVYDQPTAAMLVLGVTGTSGKTTTAYLLDAGLRAAGHRTGLVGTIETRVADERLSSAHTTPEATDLHALFAAMRERGVTAAAMEVSSHGLALGRVDGIRFTAGAFTNLSQDHLDFHHDMEDYFAAKSLLFDGRCAAEVVNVDDAWGRRLVRPRTVTVSAAGLVDALWQARDVVPTDWGMAFRVLGPNVDLPARVRLPGGFNVGNALLAIAMLVVVGAPPADAVAGVAGCAGVPGRLELVEAGQPYRAVVDYAHKPEAVATLLAALREVTTGRLVAVLGCGGDRDRGKRPLMGAAAVRGADLAVLTSDNPRSENPAAILAAMVAGAAGVGAPQGRFVVEPDRASAIELAVSQAGPGDTVVVAGKGHEQGQQFADGRVVAFDDRAVLRRAIEARL